MKLLPLAALAAPAIALACGGYFYPAPPTLDHYPERLPVKTMRELLRETNPPAADAATFDQLAAETGAIASEIGTTPAAKLLPRIDAALGRNRAGDYRKRFSNCLYDLRDLLASEGLPTAEASAYAAWRVQAMEWDDGFFSKAPLKESWNISADEFTKMQQDWQRELDGTTARLAEEIAKASPALKPHWLVQAGAWQFKHARLEAAAPFFQQVIDAAPGHPRAEVARLMLARVRMEECSAAMAGVNDRRNLPQEVWKKFESANEALTAYTAAYPQGRFAPDIPGWQGGLSRERGNLGEAIGFFLRQMDFHDHPEIVRRAVRECEACLDELEVSDSEADSPDSLLPLNEIAARPIAALAVVYHFLDSESRRDFDELLYQNDSVNDHDITGSRLAPMLRLRRAGREVLPALARAVADRKESHAASGWSPRSLAILGWAATECGDHRQALRLCELAGPSLEQSDDLLFLRAVALQRDGQLDAAIVALRHFPEVFPASPLNVEMQFRLATALRDKHESGLAVVELLRLQKVKKDRRSAHWQEPENQPKSEQATSLHLDSEIGQWIDTSLQFAPLMELERGLKAPGLEPELALRLRESLRLRYLAQENFTAAARFLEPDAPVQEPPAEENSYPHELTGDAWRKTTAKLSELTMAASAPTPAAARAAKLFELAETWAAARGHFTLPMVDAAGLFGDESDQSWKLRQRNAVVAGFTAEAANGELEQRDELRHAFHYYLQAADAAPGTELAARALWRANEAIRVMAELSPWSLARAFETDTSALSRRLHERLLRECPTSPEARGLSVWWSFVPPAGQRWLPPTHPHYQAEVAIADLFDPPDPASGGKDAWDDYDAFTTRLGEISAHTDTADRSTLLVELATLRRDFSVAFNSARGAKVVNHLDDLSHFLNEPGLTPAAIKRYFSVRLFTNPPDLEDPLLQPWRDYLTFLALVREAPISVDRATEAAIYRPMSERMREFLVKFPQSRKREAALARLAVATVRETHRRTRIIYTDWPASPSLNGYGALAVERGVPFDSPRVFAALDAYEHEFPEGRYSAEMRLWRGVASIDAGDWKTALQLLTATLDDPAHRDLHLDASLNLAEAFMRLLDQPETRPGIIAAVREQPSAQKRLRAFMTSDTLGSRLRCLEGWLDEQFAAAEK